ncbi:MAG: GNAT family N-acetyltransferase [Lachnospiraceae bacterium]|nr:GNAT family N-acetyltransferase [Candidatus Merdinaster equi]
MNQIEEILLQNADRWNQILANFPQADVYFTREYVKAFAQNGDGEARLLYYPGDDIQAMNIVMRRPVPIPDNAKDANGDLTSYYDYVTPYGYGGFLISSGLKDEKPGRSLNKIFRFGNSNDYVYPMEYGDIEAAKKKLADEYRQFCVNNRIVCEFNRYHTVIGNAHELEGLYEVRDLGHTVCIDTSSEEVIWNNFSSSNRNVIRKAEKLGVEIHYGRSKELYDEFREIYNATMDNVGAEEYYYFNEQFYDSILNDLGENAQLFYATYNGEIVAMSIIMFGGNQMHYHLSASKMEYRNLGATNLILYKAAVYGAQRGYKTFHLGGGVGSHADSLYQFKKRFNRGADTQFSIGRATFIPDVYERLCKINIGDKETGYFPAYRD